jgi:hypothetical protein
MFWLWVIAAPTVSLSVEMIGIIAASRGYLPASQRTRLYVSAWFVGKPDM